MNESSYPACRRHISPTIKSHFLDLLCWNKSKWKYRDFPFSYHSNQIRMPRVTRLASVFRCVCIPHICKCQICLCSAIFERLRHYHTESFVFVDYFDANIISTWYNRTFFFGIKKMKRKNNFECVEKQKINKYQCFAWKCATTLFYMCTRNRCKRYFTRNLN